MSNECNPEILLKEHKLKITSQRLSILKEIIKSKRAFTAASLYQKVDCPVDPATVYRILDLFHKKKIIREIPTSEEARFYEIACIHNPVHAHFFCKGCQTTSCLPELSRSDLERLKQYASGFVIDQVSVHLTGYCNKCK